MPPRPEAALPACLLGLLVPGGGHLYLGRRGKGLLFLVALGALFGLGLTMDAGLELRLGLDDPLAVVISLGQLAIGLLYFASKAAGFGLGRVTSASYEYGVTFTAVAGLLNILVVIDAYDIALGRKQ